jgi:murein L,D-transpeptidase YafK
MKRFRTGLKNLLIPALFAGAGMLTVAVLGALQANSGAAFKASQMKYPRVKEAYQDKEKLVLDRLKEKYIDKSSVNIFIRVFKKEMRLEVWARSDKQNAYLLLHNYEVCAFSGDLGPKRQGGDGQVPEGFYTIDRFNPFSNFYLSLGVSYPNQSDRILGTKGNLGGDIFIHGSCVTIGCMPLTDDKIKELYILALEARAAGQSTIPVHIFPCVMDKSGMEMLETEFKDSSAKLSFWKNIKAGFDYFENNKKLPKVSVLADGSYSFK